MTLRIPVCRLALALAFALSFPLLAAADEPSASVTRIALTPSDTQADAGKVAMLFMSRFHLQPRPMDAHLSTVVFDQLITTLDPERTLFTDADVASLSTLRETIGDDLYAGKATPLFAPVNAYLNRIVDQATFDSSLLDGGFDFSGHDTLAIDRKDAPRAASLAELHGLWSGRVKDDWLRLKLAGRDDNAIRQTLRHRYEGVISRARKTSADDAFQVFMTAYAESMDPHTDYFTPKAASQFNSEMSLSLDGIGAYLREHNDYTQVTEIMAGSPAAKSGQLHVGDRIVAIGQDDVGPMVDVTGWRTDEVVALIRGKAGTSVRLELIPDEGKPDSASRVVRMVRHKVSIEDQAAQASVVSLGVKGRARRIGVLTVPSFYEDFDAMRAGKTDYRSISRDVASMLSGFRKQQVDGVVLDLRDNGGGSLTEAVSLGGLFSGAGPVVQVKGADGAVDIETSDGPAGWTGPLVVLVNRASASASEILAAALQDRGRALVLGEKTFGKGTVQNLVDLDQAVGQTKGLGELKMTIAQFYRIDGRSTQLSGVVPDIAYPATYGEKQFGESTYSNALPASVIAAAPYTHDHAVDGITAVLLKSHDLRVAADPRWQLEVARLDEARKAADEKTLSLNLAERKRSRDDDAKRLAEFDRREAALSAADGTKHSRAQGLMDDGLTPSERPLSSQGRAKPGDNDDAFLHEAAEIAGDEAAMRNVLATGIPVV